jgi:hypothetical protein
MPKGSRSHGVYTASGARVNNTEAYAATGAPTYTSSGQRISDPVAYSGAIEASMRQNTSTPKYLYHYTEASSLSQIRDAGWLAPSTSASDTSLGAGVYFTAKQPRASSDALLRNNYDGASAGVHASRVESYVRVDADRVGAVSGRDALGRDVFVAPSADGVHLQGTGARFGYR